MKCFEPPSSRFGLDSEPTHEALQDCIDLDTVVSLAAEMRDPCYKTFWAIIYKLD